MRILSPSKFNWFEFCAPCEVPYHVYRSIEATGKRSRTFARMFDYPMNKRAARSIIRKNHEPNGRWVVMERLSQHSEPIFVRAY